MDRKEDTTSPHEMAEDGFVVVRRKAQLGQAVAMLRNEQNVRGRNWIDVLEC